MNAHNDSKSAARKGILSSDRFTDLLHRLSLSKEPIQSPVVEAILQSNAQDDNASPGNLQDASFESVATSSSYPFSRSTGGKVSPLRGRTMKEYEEQLAHLKKENFSLKLRIFFLEERFGQKFDKEDKEELYKANIELKIETEGLKRDLYDKQQLVRQASSAISSLEQQYQEQLEDLKAQHTEELDKLQDYIRTLEKDVSSYQASMKGDNNANELTQLCGLAFSAGSVDENNLSVVSSSLVPNQSAPPPNLQQLSAYSTSSPLQGIFSLPEQSTTLPSSDTEVLSNSAQKRICQLEEKVKELEFKVMSLQEELDAKEQATEALEGDVVNLKKELENKMERLADMEAEVYEKDVKIDQVMQQLEARRIDIADRDYQIQSLNDNLNKVEPEIEVKVQEIVQRDRIIEEKIEQIEQQNKILVEIQITLDEKQKQIAELEGSLQESEEKVVKLNEHLSKSCATIQVSAVEIDKRDKEINTLRKELKKKEMKIRDLVAELKESLDMLNKYKWEAEVIQGEDSIKEMAEEENERLWAELEQQKGEVLSLHSRYGAASCELNTLTKKLKDTEELLEAARNDNKMLESEHNDLIQGKENVLSELQDEMNVLKNELENRNNKLNYCQSSTEELEKDLLNKKNLLDEAVAELKKLKKKSFEDNIAFTRHMEEKDSLIDKLTYKVDEYFANKNIKSCERSAANENCFSSTSYPLGVLPSQVMVTQCNYVVPQAMQLTLASGSANAMSVQSLYQEISGVREEAHELKNERKILTNKISELQDLVGKLKLNNDSEEDNSIGVIKELEELKNENNLKDEKYGKELQDYKCQIELLKSELKATKKKVKKHLSEVQMRSYQESLQKYKEEIVSLRKRLAESHNACDMLRSRLEELADFLEKILEMDEQGIIDLSHISSMEMASLHKTLNESRALSQSLSQSLMIGMDSMMDCTSSLSPSVSSNSVSSLQKDDSLSENFSKGIKMASIPDNFADIWVQNPNYIECLYEAVASVINLQIKFQPKKMGDVSGRISCLNDQLNSIANPKQKPVFLIGELNEEMKLLQNLVSGTRKDVSSKSCQTLEIGTIHSMEKLDISPSSFSDPLPTPPHLAALEALKKLNPKELHVKLVDPQPEEKLCASNSKIAQSKFDSLVPDVQLIKSIPNTREITMQQTSPSESEAWSEPDRNVSLARIGLNTSALAVAIDRSKQARSSVVFSSESEIEGHYDEITGSRSVKRKTETTESKKVVALLHAVEQLNETLQAELHIFQTPNDAPTCGCMSRNENASEIVKSGSAAREMHSSVLPLSDALLEEIRLLQHKLEETIVNNGTLREQLEAAVNSQSNEDKKHLTTLVRTAEEEVCRLRTVNHNLTEQMETYEHNCQEKEKLVTALKVQIEEIKSEREKMKSELSKLQQNLDAKERLLLEKSEDLAAANHHCKKLDMQIIERTRVIDSLYEDLAHFQQESSLSWDSRELEEALHASESRLLAVTQERMTLVNDKKLLRMQLAAANSEAQFLKENLFTEEERNILLKEIEAGQSLIAKLQQERLRLGCEKTALETECDGLKNEIQDLKLRVENVDSEAPRSKKVESSLSDNVLCHNLIIDSEVKKLKKDVNDLNKKLDKANENLAQLTVQLDSEHCLRQNLQLQLDACNSEKLSSTETIHETSDLMTPESVTSFEFIQPSNIKPILCPKGCERKSGNKSRHTKRSSNRQDNKENINNSSRKFDDQDDCTTSGESPDLGIGSDNQFSSLERGSRVFQSVSSEQNHAPLCNEPSHSVLILDNKQLKEVNEAVTKELTYTKKTLKDTKDQLDHANNRKEILEREVCKQLTKTHTVLRQSRLNMNHVSRTTK